MGARKLLAAASLSAVAAFFVILPFAYVTLYDTFECDLGSGVVCYILRLI